MTKEKEPKKKKNEKLQSKLIAMHVFTALPFTCVWRSSSSSPTNEHQVGKMNGEESEGVRIKCIQIVSMSTEAEAMNVQRVRNHPYCDHNFISTSLSFFLGDKR